MSHSGQDRARLRLIIFGRVQGVYFRAAAATHAGKLALTGYACNRPDHTVEIVAEGPVDALKSFTEWAQHGPPGARVDHVSEQWQPFLDEFDSFRIS